MNIILIGNNGAGKSTLANKLYKEGYHVLKEAPRGKAPGHASFATLCLTDFNIVFDRWNVVDRAIYEGELEYINLIRLCPDIINRNNVIIYLTNNTTPYDDSKDPTRSVQRPSIEERTRLDYAYDYYVDGLRKAGIKVHHIEVQKDEDKTYSIVKRIIDGPNPMAGGDL